MRSVLSVSLPDEIAKELESFARRTGRTKSDIMKESLGVFLWESKLAELHKRLESKAKKAGLITEEEIFKEVS